MNYQNYKSVIDINRQTRLNDDYCEKETRIRNNRKMYKYNNNQLSECSNRGHYLESVNQTGLYQSSNRDGQGTFVGVDSDLRNGINGNILTSLKEKSDKQTETRLFIGAPFLGSGQTILKNPDIKSKLLYGEMTNSGKYDNSLSGVTINRFTPMIPSIEYNIQNVDHIIPEYWVRGGYRQEIIQKI
tara:strand:- start:21 stop:578 length:558 start_codon:yes stop_codon:yes gene_type:complete